MKDEIYQNNMEKVNPYLEVNVLHLCNKDQQVTVFREMVALYVAVYVALYVAVYIAVYVAVYVALYVALI